MKKSEMTKKRIIDAAKTIYYAEGYQSLSIRRISEVSNVAIGNIYYYYDHKELLMAELMKDEWLGTFERIKTEIECTDDADLCFKGFFRIMNEDILKRNGLVLNVLKDVSSPAEIGAIFEKPMCLTILSVIDDILLKLEEYYDKQLNNRKFIKNLCLWEIFNSVIQPENLEEIVANTLEIVKLSLI